MFSILHPDSGNDKVNCKKQKLLRVLRLSEAFYSIFFYIKIFTNYFHSPEQYL